MENKDWQTKCNEVYARTKIKVEEINLNKSLSHLEKKFAIVCECEIERNDVNNILRNVSITEKLIEAMKEIKLTENELMDLKGTFKNIKFLFTFWR